jgi:hypothetical protein
MSKPKLYSRSNLGGGVWQIDGVKTRRYKPEGRGTTWVWVDCHSNKILGYTMDEAAAVIQQQRRKATDDYIAKQTP